MNSMPMYAWAFFMAGFAFHKTNAKFVWIVLGSP
jgi:hypothetical protein